MSKKRHRCSTRDQDIPGSPPPSLHRIMIARGGGVPGSRLVYECSYNVIICVQGIIIESVDSISRDGPEVT